jgi:hypothetical protein
MSSKIDVKPPKERTGSDTSIIEHLIVLERYLRLTGLFSIVTKTDAFWNAADDAISEEDRTKDASAAYIIMESVLPSRRSALMFKAHANGIWEHLTQVGARSVNE